MDKCIECYELTFSEGKAESDASFRRFCPLHCSIIDDNVKQMLDEEILSQLSTIGQNLALEGFIWKKSGSICCNLETMSKSIQII